ncbi:MAG: hypothetical protein U5K27_05280 [Desulfotignum sp.]|nr:hypothetical protein [Desulfotignum sp.]
MLNNICHISRGAFIKNTCQSTGIMILNGTSYPLENCFFIGHMHLKTLKSSPTAWHLPASSAAGRLLRSRPIHNLALRDVPPEVRSMQTPLKST